MGKVIIIIVVLIAVVGIFVACNGGLGFGKGDGNGEAVPVNATNSVSETFEETKETTETTKVEKTIVGVNIDEEKYYFNNQPYSLDELMEEIFKINGEIEVHISLSDTATLAALEALETRLDEEGITDYSNIE